MKKSLFTLILSVTMLFMSFVPSFAVTSEENAIQCDEINFSVSAYLVSPEGEVIPCDVVNYESPQPLLGANICSLNGSSTYSSTIKVKTGDNAYKNHGISASAVMTMTWEDVFGVKNILKSVKGYFEVASGKYVPGTGMLYWGSRNYEIPTECPNSKSIGQDYDVTINYTSEDEFDGTLWARANCRVYSYETKKDYVLYVEVCPNYFD